MSVPAAPDLTATKQKSPVGLAALIVGAVAFVFAIIPVLSFIAWLPAVAAIVLGIVGLVQKNRLRAFAWIGLALGVIAWVIAIIVSIASVAGIASSVNDAVQEELASSAPVATAPVATAPAVEEAPAAEAEPTATTDPAPAEPEYSVGQQNAIGKAESYLAISAFSRDGLIKQLEFEGFPTADAEFAVDTIAPDWTAQAAQKGKEYLGISSFSRQGLVDQLVFEGFTQEQAESGATANGL